MGLRHGIKYHNRCDRMKLEKQYPNGYEAEVNELEDCFVISVTEKGITHNCHIPKQSFFEMTIKAIRGELKTEKDLKSVCDTTRELTEEDIKKFIKKDGQELKDIKKIREEALDNFRTFLEMSRGKGISIKDIFEIMEEELELRDD